MGRHWCFHVLSFITFAAVVVSIVLACLTLHRWRVDSTGRYVVADPPVECATMGRDFVTSTTCAQDVMLTCMRGYESQSDGTCSLFPAPLTQACTNSCHIEGATSAHCDALGHCIVENATDCYGLCETNGDCEDSIIMNDALINSNTPGTGFHYNWWNPATCAFGSCNLAIAEVMVSTLEQAFFLDAEQPYAVGTPFSLRYQCSDFLDPDYFATYGQCLRIERVPIDPLTNVPVSFFTDYSNSTHSLQMELCLFYFTCTRTDIASEAKKKKRSLLLPQSKGAKPLVSIRPKPWHSRGQREFLAQTAKAFSKDLPQLAKTFGADYAERKRAVVVSK